MISKFIILPTGQKMPILGFGTWNAKAEVLERALEDALEAGYRHIDTAPVYENEKIIGGVLKKWIDSGRVKREELFIVTKVPPTGNRPDGVEKWIKKSLDDLQLDYLDLYLVHTPFGFEETGDDLHPTDANGNIKIDRDTDHIAVWSLGTRGFVSLLGKDKAFPNIMENEIIRKISESRRISRFLTFN